MKTPYELREEDARFLSHNESKDDDDDDKKLTGNVRTTF